MATLWEMPCCTRSVEGEGRVEGDEGVEGHTGVCLNAGCNLARADRVEVGDVLTEYGLEVFLTNAFGVYLASVGPNDHVAKCAGKGSDSFPGMSM